MVKKIFAYIMKTVSYYIDKINRLFEITKTNESVKIRLIGENKHKKIMIGDVVKEIIEVNRDLLTIPEREM